MRDTVGVDGTLKHQGAAASASVRSLIHTHFHQENSVFSFSSFYSFP